MIWFLSREGEYLYEIYSKVTDPVQVQIGSRVLWVSRELCLQQLIYEVASNGLSSEVLNPLSAIDVLQVCQIIAYNRLDVVSKDLTFGEYLEIQRIKPIEIFKDLEFSDTLVYEKYREYLIESLQGSLSVQVYDVGWSGTIQYCLQCLLRSYVSELVELEGIYLGTFEPRYPIRTRGIICTDGQPVAAFRAIKHCTEIVEILHCSPHGRVIGVDRIEGEWVAIREGFHELGQRLEEVLEYRRIWDPVFEAIYFSNQKEQALGNLFRLLRSPTRVELEFFGDLHYISNIGEFEGRALARPECGIFYLRYPWRLLRDYKSSFWRLGFYRRLPFLYRLLLRMMMPNLRFGRSAD